MKATAKSNLMNQGTQDITDESVQLTAEEKDLIDGAFARLNAPTPDIDGEWTKLTQRLEGQVQKKSRLRSISLAATVRAALAAAACVAALFLLWPTLTKHDDPRHIISYEKQDFTNVTITTGDETRALPQGNATFTASSTHGTTVAYEMVAVKTPRGMDCHMTLADGTKVWLNGESVLEFPQTFTGSRREVSLDGEAYFEVAKDAHHPFVVKSKYYTATVLGTSFNATAYSEHNASIALVEGKVKVSDSHGLGEHILKPGDLLTLSSDHSFKLTQTDTYPYTQRKEGFFYYDNTSLRDIMLDLGRWYNKTVVFESDKDMNTRLHFVAERKGSMISVLSELAELADVDIHLSDCEIVIR
jgi:transmembrane sensor